MKHEAQTNLNRHHSSSQEDYGEKSLDDATSTKNYSDSSFSVKTWASEYRNVAPFPIFSGTPEECPATHLRRFTRVCRANNATSVEVITRIFPVTLDGEAALWYDLNIEPYEDSLSWEDKKSSFLEAYGGSGNLDQVLAKLATFKQEAGEPVRSYFLRLQSIMKSLSCYKHVPDSLITGIFIDGFSENCRDWIASRGPKSLDNALALAFEFERGKAIEKLEEKVMELGISDGRLRRLREVWETCRDEESELPGEYSDSGADWWKQGENPDEMSRKGNRNDDSRSRCRCSKHGWWKGGKQG